MYVATTAAPEYMEKIWTHGKGVITPTQKDNMSVIEVMVMDTAASA